MNDFIHERIFMQIVWAQIFFDVGSVCEFCQSLKRKEAYDGFLLSSGQRTFNKIIVIARLIEQIHLYSNNVRPISGKLIVKNK